MLKKLSYRQMPALILAIFFSVGVMVHNMYTLSSGPLSLLFCSFLVLLVMISNKNLSVTWKHFILLVIIVLAGSIHTSFQVKNSKAKLLDPKDLENLDHVIGEVQQIKNSEKYYNLTVKIDSIELGNRLSNRICPILILVKVKREEPLSVLNGDYIKVKLSLRTLNNSNSDQYKGYWSYLANQGILYTGFANYNDLHTVEGIKSAPWKIVRFKIRNSAIKYFDKTLKEPHAGLVKALLLGHKDNLDADIKQSFTDSGIVHILAVSGLHVGIVLSILVFLFQKLSKRIYMNNKMKSFLIILTLILFAEISGGAVPVWRATLMASIYLICRSYSYEIHPLNIIGSAGLLFLLIDYRTLYSLSFQLSFLAVIGIIIIYPILDSLHSSKNFVGKKVIPLLYLGLAAQISLSPLSLFYFNKISLISPLSSALAIPLAYIIIIIGILVIFSGWVNIQIAEMLSTILEYSIDLLFIISNVFSNIRYGSFTINQFHIIEVFILLCAIFTAALAIRKRSITQLKFSAVFLISQGALHSIFSQYH